MTCSMDTPGRTASLTEGAADTPDMIPLPTIAWRAVYSMHTRTWNEHRMRSTASSRGKKFVNRKSSFLPPPPPASSLVRPSSWMHSFSPSTRQLPGHHYAPVHSALLSCCRITPPPVAVLLDTWRILRRSRTLRLITLKKNTQKRPASRRRGGSPVQVFVYAWLLEPPRSRYLWHGDILR